MSAHRSPKIHRDPPNRPPRLVDDGYLVEPEPLDKPIPYLGWYSIPRSKPIRRELALIGFGVCLGIIVAILVLAVAAQLDSRGGAAPSSGQTTAPVDLSGSLSAGQSGAPLGNADRPDAARAGLPTRAFAGSSPASSGSPRSRSSKDLQAAAEPSGVTGTPLYSASATWCAPTPTQCQGWAPPARLAAVNGFRFGDAPYWIRVWRGDRFADALVVSFCRCQDTDAAVDLSVATWTQLEPDLGIGRVAVTVEVLDWPYEPGGDPPPHPDDDRMRVEDGGQ